MGGRGLRSCQGDAHCAWSLLPHKLGGSPSQGTLGADGSKNKEWGSLRSPRREETLLPLLRPRPYSPGAAGRRSWVTTAPDDLRAGRGERWPCRSGDRRAAPEPLSAPPSLGWSLGGQGAGGWAMVTHLPPLPPPAGLGLGHPALGLHSTHRAVPRLLRPAGVTPDSPSTLAHLILAWGWGLSGLFPCPAPFPAALVLPPGGARMGKGGQDGKGFLSQQPESRKTGQCHLPDSGVSRTAA